MMGEKDPVITFIFGIILGMTFTVLLVMIILLLADSSIQCDLGDNKTLKIELEGDEFIPPNDESIKSCKVIM